MGGKEKALWRRAKVPRALRTPGVPLRRSKVKTSDALLQSSYWLLGTASTKLP